VTFVHGCERATKGDKESTKGREVLSAKTSEDQGGKGSIF